MPGRTGSRPPCKSGRRWPGREHRVGPPSELNRGNQYFCDQLILWRGSWIVGVIFNAEVIAHLNFLFGDNLKNSTASLRQVGIRPGQDKTAVFAAFEFFVL